MFKWITAAIGTKIVFVPIQLIVAVGLVVAHIAMLGFFSFALLFIYNRINDLLDYVSTISDNNELLAISFKVLQSIGFIQAFNDVFAIFSPFLIAFLVYKATLQVFHSFKVTSDEVFKIGVLVGQ